MHPPARHFFCSAMVIEVWRSSLQSNVPSTPYMDVHRTLILTGVV